MNPRKNDEPRAGAINIEGEGVVVEDAVFENNEAAIIAKGGKAKLSRLGFRGNKTDIYSDGSQLENEGLAFLDDPPNPRKGISVLISRKNPCIEGKKCIRRGGHDGRCWPS